jgi:hypothetical protein
LNVEENELECTTEVPKNGYIGASHMWFHRVVRSSESLASNLEIAINRIGNYAVSIADENIGFRVVRYVK